ncbi:MAG: hypothetical protein ACKOE8_08925, partial [Opitutaceae bacterium]
MPRQIRKSPLSLVVLCAVAGRSLPGCGRPAGNGEATAVRKSNATPTKAPTPSPAPEAAKATASTPAP